jgi:predicted transcriptional regulator
MDLTTNGAIVTDAMKYVIQKTEQVNTLQKLDERIEGIEEEEREEATTNGVF